MEDSPWLVLVFGWYYLSFGLGLLNFILGTIVNTAAEAKRADDKLQVSIMQLYEHKLKSRIMRCCKSLDKEKSGYIKRDCFAAAYNDENSELRKVLTYLKIASQDVIVLMDVLDFGGQGDINYCELADAIVSL